MLTEQLIENLAGTMKPVSPTSGPARTFLNCALAAVAYIAVSAAFLGIRPDLLHKLSSPLFDAELFTLTGIILSSLLSAALLAFPDIYQKYRLIWLPALFFMIFAGVIGIELAADNPPAPPPPHSEKCLICISLLSLLPAACMLFVLRRFATTHYYMAGKIAVLAAFSIGALALRLSEMTDSIPHLIVWHYLPMIGAGIIGLFLGRLCLKW